MNYCHERNYGCRIKDELIYRGLHIIVMENEKIKVSIVVDKGTEHLPTVARSEGNFMDYYEGGWQELLPNPGFPCVYKGAQLGLHGEVALVPWKYSIIEDSPDKISVKFWVRTYRTPFYLQKVLTINSDKPTLLVEERLVNEGKEKMELGWGHDSGEVVSEENQEFGVM